LEFPWLIHGFSTRRDACGGAEARPLDFNLGFSGGAHPARRDQVEANRRRFLGALGASSFTLASLNQIHSATVHQVVRGGEDDPARRGTALEYRPTGWPLPRACDDTKSASPGTRGQRRPAEGAEQLAAGDALVTGESGVMLTIRTADCLPVLLVDRRQRAVAAVHAGWRGALARVIEKTVAELRRLFTSRPEELVAALGPGIGACCYEVGPEVVDAFRGGFAQCDKFFRCPPPGREDERYPSPSRTQSPARHAAPHARLCLDLVAVARAQLRAAGLRSSAIHASGYCTACHADLFFSYRRERSRAGRMMAAIAIRP
jgi:polyphenol oxidase